MGAGFSDDVSHILLETSHGRCARTMTRGLEIRVHEEANVWSIIGSGCESFCRGPRHWIRGWGLSMGSVPGTAHWY